MTTSPNILVVEDEPIVALDIERRLSILGFSADVASSGEEAVQKAGEMRHALILMDIVLPGGIDGVEAAQEIWGKFRTPVVYLTAYSDAGMLARAETTNPFGYLLKPISDRELLATIKIALHKSDAENRLRDSEERYRSLVTSMSQIVWTTDANFRIVNDVPALREYTGLTMEEINDRGWEQVIHPEDLDRMLIAHQKGIETSSMFEIEYRMRGADGNYHIFFTRAVPILGSDGKVREWIGTCDDINDRKILEEQLRQSQRMEALGSLAGGVAHDFNNLLTGIICYSDMALGEVSEDDPLHKDLEEIKLAGERAAGLTRQLLTFSRKQMVHPEVVDINVIITGLEKMLMRIIEEDIEMKTSLSAALGAIRVDAGQIEQIVMNLVVNARDAMPHGGELIIKTENMDFTEPRAGLDPGSYVMLTVSDNGAGMDATTQSRMFDPFFTTKQMGRGTGLGLSIVHGIVKQSGGSINVSSAPGKGTTFKIYFPRADETVAATPSPIKMRTTGGTETILIAEDEGLVRDLISNVLSPLGYNLLVASNGVAALKICEEYKGEIHLLLTDVVMPTMGGRELMDKITAIHPGIRVLFVSGYTGNTIDDHGSLPADAGFLQKPFSAGILTAKVREMLDQEMRGIVSQG